MIWYRAAYVIALTAALMRGWRMKGSLGLWWYSLLVSAVLSVGYHPEALSGIWPWLLIVAPISRALAASEAFARLVAAEFHDHARTLQRASRALALCPVLILRVLMPAGAGSAFAWWVGFGAYLRIWTAAWLLVAVLFLFIWPGLRISAARHALIVEAILLVDAAGVAAWLRGATWTPWHSHDMLLYLLITTLLLTWTCLIPCAVSPARVVPVYP